MSSDWVGINSYLAILTIPWFVTSSFIYFLTPSIKTGYCILYSSRAREIAYPNWKEFAEAYTEKEIGEDSTKWDAYVTAYNKVRSDNLKP